MREFFIGLWIGDIATSGHVKIMDCYVFGGPRFLAKADADMAAIIFCSENSAFLACKRQARDNGHAMIAFLTVHCDVGVAEPFKITAWKLIIWALCFLQTQHVWTRFFQEALHKTRTKTDGVDIPSGDGQAQGRSPIYTIRGIVSCAD